MGGTESRLPLHPEIEASFNSFEDRLQAAAGVDVERASPDRFEWEAGWRAYGIVQGHQIGETIPLLQRWIGRFLSRGAMGRSPHFIKPIQDGYLRRTAQFEESLATRAELAAALDRFLDRYDVWALPVSLVPAFKHLKPSFERGFLRDYDHMFDINGQSINYFEALTRLTTLFNLTGHPVVTIPAGRDSRSGVPIGVQLVGKPGEESRLLAVARLLETSI